MEKEINSQAVRNLANAVILSTVRDFEASYKDPKKIAENLECYHFLTCRTGIGEFWFQVAGVPPMTGGRKEIYARIRRNKNERMVQGRRYKRAS